MTLLDTFFKIDKDKDASRSRGRKNKPGRSDRDERLLWKRTGYLRGITPLDTSFCDEGSNMGDGRGVATTSHDTSTSNVGRNPALPALPKHVAPESPRM